MTALEQFVITVRNLSTQGQFEQLCEYCGKNSEILVKNTAHLDDALATLDLQEHSIGVLAILCVKMNLANQQDLESVHAQVTEFLANCNGEQVRVAPDLFADLCHNYTASMVESRQPLKGINHMMKAINKIKLFDSQLTSIHADLCQLCLLSKCVKPAIQFLDVDVTDISREAGQFDVKYFLLYYYYGGMIYASLKNYERALYFFEAVLTIHSMAVSHIMLEAYKKYVLISLIVHGKLPNLPKYTPQVVSRYIKPFSLPYTELASAYTTNNPDDVSIIITKHTEAYVRDKNFGLVKQVLGSLYRKNIQRLTKTFLTLSLADVASRVRLADAKEAEEYVVKMIADKEIYGMINQKDGMVVFHDNPEKFDTARMFKNIEDKIASCMRAEDTLLQMDRDIAVNPKFIQKLKTEAD
ncbi:COP9 signalosome complex subunit 3 [Halotydeus destructor]|nr:COP9 signalosome complex subunit 3 [Halotydeus destructor]